MDMEQAIQTLRSANDKISLDSPDACHQVIVETIRAQVQVRSHYQSLFSPGRVNDLPKEEFLEFLLPTKNKHWSSLWRRGPEITADMPLLRKALALLVDEKLPLKTRLNQLRPKTGDPMIKWLAQAIITPILHIVYPEKYGVLNRTAKDGMRQVGAWPESSKGASFADRYEATNGVLLELAQELRVELWTLDALWWLMLKGSRPFYGGVAGTSQERS